MPSKAVREDEPFIYWVSLPSHNKLSEQASLLRHKFNNCLQSVVKSYDSMCVIKFKDMWSPNDLSMIINDSWSDFGLLKYWKAVDAALRFNVLKHEQFMVKSKHSRFVNMQSEQRVSDKKTAGRNLEEIQNFFRRHRQDENTFHWPQRRLPVEEHRGHRPQVQKNRFLLPKLKH